MPPKPSAKASQKKAEKIIEDKTFGLKNKNKSKKVQQYVQQVEQAVKNRGKNPRQLALEQEQKMAKKIAKEQKEKELNEMTALFKTVDTIKQQEVAENVDPKSVICAYFKAGLCRRGNKCKFSHDVDAVRKVAKINLYSDPRDNSKNLDETMENWDQATLESVIASKEKVRTATPTDIVCKYFLDAVEQRKYGFRWECPSGDKCHYRHALPPGFVLKSQQKDEDKEKEEDVDNLGVAIEEERAKLDYSKCTPVTKESFEKWKAEQKQKRAAAVEEKRAAQAKKTGGRGTDILSGRDLFQFDPSLFVDDDEAEQAYEIQTPIYEEAEEEKSERNYPLGGNDDEEEVVHDELNENNDAAAPVGDASLFLEDDDALPDDEDDETDEAQKSS